MTEFDITDAPNPDDLEALRTQLASFNDRDVGPANMTPLAIFVPGEDGALAAGLSGYTAWGWLYVQWLWVGEDLRGQGMAGSMLEAAEREAVGRGCHGALIDTFSPTALSAYRRQGYEVFGELADFPMGRARSFLCKRFDR